MNLWLVPGVIVVAFLAGVIVRGRFSAKRISHLRRDCRDWCTRASLAEAELDAYRVAGIEPPEPTELQQHMIEALALTRPRLP